MAIGVTFQIFRENSHQRTLWLVNLKIFRNFIDRSAKKPTHSIMTGRIGMNNWDNVRSRNMCRRNEWMALML